MRIYVIPGTRTAPSMRIYVIPATRTAPSMRIYVIPATRTAPSMRIYVIPATRTAPGAQLALRIHLTPAPGCFRELALSEFRAPPGCFRVPPGFFYFGWLSGATLKSDFSLLIFVNSALRRPRALSGHFPGPPAGEHAQHYLCVFT